MNESSDDRILQRVPIGVLLIVGAGFAGRLAIGLLLRSEASLLDNGYGFYHTLARTFIEGGGLCLSQGVKCAARLPLYPLLLTPFEAAGWLYPGLVILQAAIGAATALLAWSIGREVFTERAGVIAAALTACNPYALVHDTALQETSLVNVLVAFTVLTMLRLRRTSSGAAAAVAGLALSCAVLTSARVALLVPAVILWMWFYGGPAAETRLRHVAVVTLAVLVILGAWTVRNWRLVGAPTLTTETGQALWLAQNEWTFSHFPTGSIDASAATAYARLSSSRRQALASIGEDEIAFDRLHARWAAEEIAANPARSAQYAIRKLWAVISGQLSPARGPIVQTVYMLLFVPVHLLAIAALWRTRADYRAHALVGAIGLAFMVTTAIFWAHTSHKSMMDALLFVYAGATLATVTASVGSTQGMTRVRDLVA